MVASISWFAPPCPPSPLSSPLPPFLSPDLPPAADFGLLRLTGGTSQREGHLEVYYNETWAPVCSLSFGLTEANVSCNQLGYDGAFLLGEISLSGGSAWTSAVDCHGDEQRLVECDYWGWGVPCDAVVTLECTGMYCTMNYHQYDQLLAAVDNYLRHISEDYCSFEFL